MVGHRDIGEVVSGEPARLDRLIAGAYDHQPRLLARRVAQVLHGHGQVLGHPVAVLSYLSQRLAAEHPSDVGPVRVQVASRLFSPTLVRAMNCSHASPKFCLPLLL